MEERAAAVVVVGVGARTPLGFSATSSTAAVRAGISAIQDHPYMIDRFGERMRVTRDPSIDIEIRGPTRLVEIALPAALDALAPVRAAIERASISLVLATGEARPGQGEGFDREVYRQLRERLSAQVDIASGSGVYAGGHAGGLVGLMRAAGILRDGSATFCLVGGVDSYLEPETLEWLDENEQLHSEGNIYGFCPGEAAGFCLLTTIATARQYGLKPLVQMVNVAAAQEKNRIKTPTICLGEGLAAAFRDTFANGRFSPVDRIICDMNGERYRGNEYGLAVLRNPGRFRDAADFETPADCWGDLGAASAPLHVSLVTEAHGRGYAKGPLSFIWASSENGTRAAALLAEAGRVR